MLYALLALNLLVWLAVLAYAFKLVPPLARRWNLPSALAALAVAVLVSMVSYQSAVRSQVKQQAQTHYYAGIDEKERGNLAEAEKQFERALSLQPGHPEARHELAEVRQQKPAEKRVQKRAAAVDPNATTPAAGGSTAAGGGAGASPSAATAGVPREPRRTAMKPPAAPPPPPNKGTPGEKPKPAAHKPSPFEITHYSLDLNLNPEKHRFVAAAEIRIRSRGQAVRVLDFSLSEECKPTAVTVDGIPTPFKHTNDLLSITPARELAARGEGRVRVSYRREGSPIMEEGTALLSTKSVYFLSESRWYPATGELDFRAPVRVRVEVPKGYTAVSVGALKRTEKKEKSVVYEWETDRLASMVSLTAARFSQESVTVPPVGEGRGDLKITCYTFPEHRGRAKPFLKEAAAITRYFEKLYGPYPYEKLGVTEIALFPGGYGTSSFVMLVDESFREKRIDREFLAHEIAHQWWGNSVFPQGLGAAWLTEAFSNYSAWMYEAAITGNPRVLRKRVAEARRRFYAAMAVKGDQAIYESDPYLHVGAAEQTIYEKGAAILHMLREEIGDKAFMRSLRAFATEYRFGKAKIEDFRRVVDRKAGRSLQWFFDQWLGRPGGMALAYSFDTEPDTKEFNQGVLMITQTKPPYRARLKVVLDVENSVETREFEISEEHHTFRFPIKGKLTNVLIDPDGDYLMPPPKWVVQ